MQISDHKTRAIFDRYHIVSEGDLREATRRRSTPLAKDRDKIGTIAPFPSSAASTKKP